MLATLALLGACRGEAAQDRDEPTAQADPAATSDLAVPAAVPTRARVLVSHASELEALVLAEVEYLDLAFAESDRLGRLTEFDASTACLGLDLAEIAARAPRLGGLRLSGCTDATRGLTALTSIDSLTLAELELDAQAILALSQLTGLRSLTLVRVAVPEKLDLAALEKLALREVALIDLPRESPLGQVLDMWPGSLTRATLAGPWAAHDAMTQIAKAQSLEALELRDTRVSNFSLNQIKPLSRLRELTWSGDTFNDNSPLYFRDLDIKRFTCDCPRFGDGGLHTLRHCESVEQLTLPRARVTGPGLAALAKLPALRELVLMDRDIGPQGLAALQLVPSLRRLELSGSAAAPTFVGLGALGQLEQLRLHYLELDDQAAVEIGRLVALRDLDLAETQISDVGMAHFAALVNLRVLVLSHTRVTNRGLAALSGLAGLRQLHLDHTDVIDAAVTHLTPLVGLETLRLDHTLVTDGAIEQLLGLTALTRLDVSGTVITPEGLTRLETLPNLVELAGGPDPLPP